MYKEGKGSQRLVLGKKEVPALQSFLWADGFVRIRIREHLFVAYIPHLLCYVLILCNC